MKTLLILLGALGLGVIGQGPAHAQAPVTEPAGKWKAPAEDGSPWTHSATGLVFPQILGPYRLKGDFTYADGGTLLRYENTDARARADIFIFRSPAPVTSTEDIQRLLLRELDTVESDMRVMVRQGRYKNLQFTDAVGKELELWQRDPLPIAIRTLTATRVSATSAVDEAVIKQWIGVTLLSGHLITIRHLRPLDTGAEGEGDMEGFVGNIFQVIKDPSLRQEIQKLVSSYHADPFSRESEQAAAAVLAYLDKSPTLPIHVPERPISAWLERCKAVAPGTEIHLLRAFMLGSAKAALEGAGPAASVNAGARQFARVYRQLVQQHPAIALPEMQPFIAAAEKDAGAEWLRVNQ